MVSGTPRSQQGSLTAFLLITVIEAVWQPITLPGPRDAAPVTAHEVSRNVAFIGEVIPRQQLALCNNNNEKQTLQGTQKRQQKQSQSKMLISSRTNFRQTILTPVILLYHSISILNTVLGSTSFLKSWFHRFSSHTLHFTDFFRAVFFLGTYI